MSIADPGTAVVRARFVDRPNRFLAIAELDDGGRVAAYLPNTGRLRHLATPGRPLILRRDGTPPRTTEYTVTRAWDGCWVALEASRAPHLLAAWLLAGHPLGGFGTVSELRHEVAAGGHRLDLVATTDTGRVWVEVKSGGRSVTGTALLSQTPSSRGVAHLATLAGLAAAGEHTVVAFVVQRGDARRLLVGGDADPGWIDAVRAAHEAGVTVMAVGCDVTETTVMVVRALPVVWEDEVDLSTAPQSG
jgi:sugar fermentation stimulation protein A